MNGQKEREAIKLKNILLVILDGLGDRPNKSLGDKTALQAAYRPNMNRLIREGQGGLMNPIAPGIRAGSDTSHLSILGYDPEKFYTGRGPFEAMGIGLEVLGGDIAFRANFGTRDSNGIVKDRRAGRISEGTDKLAASLNMEIDGVKFMVREGVEHRAALVMRGENLSDHISDSDPHEVGLPVRTVYATGNDGKRTADLINKFLDEARKILDNHPVNRERISRGMPPANELLLRGPGKTPELISFRDTHEMSAACVAAIPMISGIGKLLKMDVYKPKGSTGTLDSDLVSKLTEAGKLTKKYDFVMVNVKAPDVAGHDGNPEAKRTALEKFDVALGRMLEIITDDIVIAVTGDHATPCSVRDHSGDPVPILFNTRGILRDGASFFDEASAASGMWRIRGLDVMNILKQMAGRSEKYGA